MSAEPFDLRQVLREIEDEVEARRASGDFPRGLERDLDLVFARFAPVGVVGADFDGVIQIAERAAFFDPLPPAESRIPGVGLLKRSERKLLGWWFRYLGNQITVFGSAVVEALRHLGSRVDALQGSGQGSADELLGVPVASLGDGARVEDALRHLAGGGRTLVADSGRGELVDALLVTGTDAYGIDPHIDEVEISTRRGLDVRAEGVLGHLRSVEDGALTGMLLTGCVDRLPVGMLLELADLAAAALADGGRLAVVSAGPFALGALDPVVADLAPGRPLHAETWLHILGTRGFDAIAVHGNEPPADDAVSRLERAVFGGGAYAVTAVRRR